MRRSKPLWGIACIRPFFERKISRHAGNGAVTLRSFLSVFIFSFLFLTAGTDTPVHSICTAGQNAGAPQLVERKDSAFLPVVISRTDSVPVKEIRTQRPAAPETGIVPVRRTVPVLFLFFIFITFSCRIVNKYILHLLLLQTVR